MYGDTENLEEEEEAKEEGSEEAEEAADEEEEEEGMSIGDEMLMLDLELLKKKANKNEDSN